MKLSELIIEYRSRMNISQREFSRKCDLSNTYISFIENEKNPKTGRPVVPTLEQYKKLADGMGISVQRLFELLDDDAPVDLSGSSESSETSYSDEPVIRTPEARILAKGIDKLPQAQREQALAVIRAMFDKYAPYFEKENDDQ
jgi:transcriptional regulator with XRE-family HTH domain